MRSGATPRAPTTPLCAFLCPAAVTTRGPIDVGRARSRVQFLRSSDRGHCADLERIGAPRLVGFVEQPLNLHLPSWKRLFGEGPAIVRLLAAQFRTPLIKCQPVETAPVLVLPAFLAGDFHTRLLRRTVRGCGGQAFGWGQGLNTGMSSAKFARLLDRVDRLADEAGPLVLVGWSLGGLYARELAKQRSNKVAMVVTLGTPFSHGPGRNNGRPVYNLLNDHDADHPPVTAHPEQKPPVFTVACWSPTEGMVAPLSAAGEDEEADVRVQLHCMHHVMVTDPDALRTLIAILRAGRVLGSPRPTPSGTCSGVPGV